jgi:hypothetical protein
MAFQQYPQKFGIPSGNTAGRPSNPVIGDTYYNGQLGILEIYDGTNWIPNSAPPGIPSVVGVDVGTGRAFTSGALTITFTPSTNGGAASGFGGSAVLGATTYSTGNTSATTITLAVGEAGSYSVSGTAFNGFGTSPSAVPTNVTVTTVPQAPTIGTATASTSANEITVTWTLGNNGGKNLSAITITPYLNGTTAATSRNAATTSSTSYTFTSGQLTGGSSYTFKVKTTNANGDSLESSASNSATMPNLVALTDVLVVAGGGGSGGAPRDAWYPGGGGAGGYRTSSTALVALNTGYQITVGAGGSGGSGGAGSNSTRGNQGANSTVGTAAGTFAATGGGGGGAGQGASGQFATSGGSGGGAGSPSTGLYPQSGGAGNAGSYSPVEGYAGGETTGGGGSGYSGAGGGSAGVGPNYSGTTVSGGSGTSNSITGSPVTYAAGGGVSLNTTSSNASANTGNGATGATLNGSGGTTNGSNGGSGIIVLKIADTRTISFSGGVTFSGGSASGGFKTYTITAAGVSDTYTVS